MNYRTQPAFSLSTSSKKNILQMPHTNSSSPGPIYLPSQTTQNHITRTSSIGKAGRQQINHGIELTPPPGHYSPQKIHHSKQIYSIPQSSFVNPENEVPSPGTHDPIHKWTKSRLLSYQMGEKYPSIMDSVNKNPGPGHYQTSRSLPVLNKSKNITENRFGTSQRFKYQDNGFPGAGKYNVKTVDQLIQKKITFSKDQKLKTSNQIMPGPSEYLIKSEFTRDKHSKQGKTMSMRYNNPLLTRDPTSFAFIKYFENNQNGLVTHPNSQKYSFGKQTRENKNKSNSPGPNQYNTDSFVPKNSVHTVFPQALRYQYNGTITNPGPGTYDIPSESGHKAVIGKSKSVSFLTSSPGPGRYEPKMIAKQSNRFGFPRQKRNKIKKDSEACVGEYNVSGTLQRNKGGFGKAERFAYDQSSKPGPGDYHIANLVGYVHHQTKASLHS